MKNKQLTILCIVLLSLLVVSLSLFMIFGLYMDNDRIAFLSSPNHKISEKTYALADVSEIDIKSIVSDVEFKETKGEEIEVTIYGKKEKDAKVELSGGTLIIDDTGKGTICIGFCYDQRKIVVKMPQKKLNALTIKTTSGGVHARQTKAFKAVLESVSGDITFGEGSFVKVRTTSGDIDITSASDADIKTVSGEIELATILNSVSLSSTSGDIAVKNFMIQKNSTIKTVSGDVALRNISDIYVDTKTVSGDVSIKQNNRKAKYEVQVKTTSGDIWVD